MSTFSLKLLAIITMMIDHIGAVLVSPATHPQLYFLCRAVGRLAFPIFVFLIVEGFYHTSNIKRYLKRLGIFAFVSEIPFDLAFYRFHNGASFIKDFAEVFNDGIDMKQLAYLLERLNRYQNVFFTLFLGLALIYLMNLVDLKFKRSLESNLLDAGLTIAFCILAILLQTDYNFAGILLFVAFYLFRESKILMSISLFIICGTILSDIQAYIQTKNILHIISMLATFAMIPIAFYNGKKGKNVKYIFYIFYPAHLMIIFLISIFI